MQLWNDGWSVFLKSLPKLSERGTTSWNFTLFCSCHQYSFTVPSTTYDRGTLNIMFLWSAVDRCIDACSNLSDTAPRI